MLPGFLNPGKAIDALGGLFGAGGGAKTGGALTAPAPKPVAPSSAALSAFTGADAASIKLAEKAAKELAEQQKRMAAAALSAQDALLKKEQDHIKSAIDHMQSLRTQGLISAQKLLDQEHAMRLSGLAKEETILQRKLAITRKANIDNSEAANIEKLKGEIALNQQNKTEENVTYMDRLAEATAQARLELGLFAKAEKDSASDIEFQTEMIGKNAIAIAQASNHRAIDLAIQQKTTEVYIDTNKQLQLRLKVSQDVADAYKAEAEAAKAVNDAQIEKNYYATQGNKIYEETRTKTENLYKELADLETLMQKGAISQDTYSRAVIKAHQDYASDLDLFTQNAAKNIQNSLADFLFDPFKNGLDGMLAQFGQFVQRAIAEAVAADLTKRLFGAAGGGTGGGVMDLLGMFGGGGGRMNGDGFGPPSPSSGSSAGGWMQAAMGLFSSFAVGTDYVPRDMMARVHQGERIVPADENRRGGPNIVVNVTGNNGPDVRRAAGQGAREALGFMGKAARYK